MKLVGIDPGRVTGMCFFNTLDGGGAELMRTAEVIALVSVYQFLRNARPDLIIMENFTIGSARVNYRDPIEVIGAVKLYAEIEGIDVIFQSASVLVNIKKYSEGLSASKHIRSCCTHVITYMIKNLGVTLDAIC